MYLPIFQYYSKRGLLTAKPEHHVARHGNDTILKINNQTLIPSLHSKKDNMSRRTKRIRISQEEEEDELPLTVDLDDNDNEDYMFSQQIPEASQGVPVERPSERRKLEEMDKVARDKAVTSISRLILFKALEREPIDRLKIIKEAGLNSVHVTGALFKEAADRLQNVFGFELKRIPKYMENRKKSVPKKYADRYYVQNSVEDTQDGAHSMAIHSVHLGPSIEKGFVLLVNALIFCKGESRSDGSRWILGRDLYRLLNELDDSLPSDPPAQGTARAKGHSKANRIEKNMSPNPDALLEQFVHWDYLIKEKAVEENFASQTLEEGDVLYGMGPRSAIEIGRKQIIYFCAEVLDEVPCPTMLKEVEDDEEEDEDEELENEVYMEE